jgi:hypothetical protein
VLFYSFYALPHSDSTGVHSSSFTDIVQLLFFELIVQLSAHLRVWQTVFDLHPHSTDTSSQENGTPREIFECTATASEHIKNSENWWMAQKSFPCGSSRNNRTSVSSQTKQFL